MKILMKYLIASLTFLWIGCFSVTSQKPLSVTDANLDRQTEKMAILPISADQVRFMLELPDNSKMKFSATRVGGHEDLLQCANSVLNTLIGEKKGSMVGPQRVKQLLKGTNDLQSLSVCFRDPDPITTKWKIELLSEICKKLDAKLLVFVSPIVKLKPLEVSVGDSGVVESWSGRAIVSLKVVGIEPPQLIKTCSGESNFWGKFGIVGGGDASGAIFLPFAFGKSLCRAVDEATRQALSDLTVAPTPLVK
jgi:hypothetical protein